MLWHLALSETAGNTFVGGLVAGLPVLVTRSCGFYFHVQEAQAGMVVGDSVFDQMQFNQQLKDALGDPQCLAEWGRNALAYSDVVDLYSRPQQAVKIMQSSARR